MNNRKGESHVHVSWFYACCFPCPLILSLLVPLLPPVALLRLPWDTFFCRKSLLTSQASFALLSLCLCVLCIHHGTHYLGNCLFTCLSFKAFCHPHWEFSLSVYLEMFLTSVSLLESIRVPDNINLNEWMDEWKFEGRHEWIPVFMNSYLPLSHSLGSLAWSPDLPPSSFSSSSPVTFLKLPWLLK